MEAENDEGNIEYKLKINPESDKRKNELVTQMGYRLNEGYGECIYMLGVKDNGELEGINENEYTSSMKHLNDMILLNDSIIVNVSKREVNLGKSIYEIMIRENIENKYIDIKVAVAGNVDSGKSSLIGVLINGKKDNGRGLARLSVFNYPHEIKTGRTSSIAHQIMGFDSLGNIVNYDNQHKLDWPEIVKKSSKIISFYDLAGHEKYLKTTILGLSSCVPDLCLITIGANMGVTKMTKEHIFLCIMLNIPFIVVITKIDICKNREDVLKQTIQSIKKLLKLPGIRRVTYKINNKEDILLTSKNRENNSIVPLFYISNVTGEGIDLVKNYLNFINKHKDNKNNEAKNVEFHIDSTFYVTGVGTIVGGQLKFGTISIGDKLYLGPNTNQYDPYIVKSIHVKRTNVDMVKASCYACLCLKRLQRKNVRKGYVLLGEKTPKLVIREFDADITVLKSHATTIRVGYEPILHVMNIRQSAKIIKINNRISSKNNQIQDNILRTGDKASVRFRFKVRGEFLKEGYKILLAEGRIKIVGQVKKIYT